jgi:hypothetical protein
MATITSSPIGDHTPHRVRTVLLLVLAAALTTALVVMVFSLRTGSAPAAPAPEAPAAPVLHSRCQLTADAAQAWLEHGAGTPTCQGPGVESDRTMRCGGSADAVEHWANGGKATGACVSR